MTKGDLLFINTYFALGTFILLTISKARTKTRIIMRIGGNQAAIKEINAKSSPAKVIGIPTKYSVMFRILKRARRSAPHTIN